MTNSSQIPAQVEKYLDAISFWNDGSLILASSNLTGRYWIGSVWFYKNPDLAPDVEKCTGAIELDAGVCDIAIINGADKKSVIIGLDSGSVELLQINETSAFDEATATFLSEAYSCEHDDSVIAIKTVCNDKQAISGSYDKSIKIWDLQCVTASATYQGAHWDLITGISCHQESSDIFASSGRDGRVLTWDTRIPKPATEIVCKNLNGVPTTVSWKPSISSLLAIGDESGQIVVIDPRNVNNTLKKINVDNRGIYRLEFAPYSPNLVASVADSVYTKIINFEDEQPKIIYEDDCHTDFVRGVAWHPVTRKLYTSGWDKQVVSHKFGLAMETNG